MKNRAMMTTALAAVLALGLTAFSASAQQGKAGGQAAGAGQGPAGKGQMMLDRFDTNSDGKLTQAEFQAGCDKGLVQGTASTGSGAGTNGSGTHTAASVCASLNRGIVPQP